MNKDLKEMFREKNRLIIITNLKYDLEKNIQSLLDTITNIFNLEFDTAIKNMISIHEDSNIYDGNTFITNEINRMKKESYTELEELLIDKKDKLEGKIDCLEFEEDCLNEYYDFVVQTTKNLREKLNDSIRHFQDNDLKQFHEFISKYVTIEQETLIVNRVTDYLKNRLYGKLETKIHMEIMLRDNNLINKANESYLRFQEISSRTTEN